MSLINDALKRAESAKLDKLAEADAAPEMPAAAHKRPKRGRLIGPIVIVCLLLITGGVAAHRYLDIDLGFGDGPQIAAADPNTPAPTVVTAAPVVEPAPPITPAAPTEPVVVAKAPAPKVEPKIEPKVEEPVNPAFKDLTAEDTLAMRAEIAKAAVQNFLDAGAAMNKYAVKLATVKPVRVKPKTKPVKPIKVAQAKPVAKPKPVVAKPKPVAVAPVAAPKRTVDPSQYQLNGIMYNGVNSMAIINGTVYRIGQKVSGAIVEGITPKYVTLKLDGQKFKIYM